MAESVTTLVASNKSLVIVCIIIVIFTIAPDNTMSSIPKKSVRNIKLYVGILLHTL